MKSWFMIVGPVDMVLSQVLVNYARSSKEAEEVAKEASNEKSYECVCYIDLFVTSQGLEVCVLYGPGFGRLIAQHVRWEVKFLIFIIVVHLSDLGCVWILFCHFFMYQKLNACLSTSFGCFNIQQITSNPLNCRDLRFFYLFSGRKPNDVGEGSCI